MSVPPLISTEVLGPHDMVGQDLGSLGASLNPSDANLRDAGLAIGLVTATGMLLAVRNPRSWLAVLAGTLGANILASFVILSRPSAPSPTATATAPAAIPGAT